MKNCALVILALIVVIRCGTQHRGGERLVSLFAIIANAENQAERTRSPQDQSTLAEYDIPPNGMRTFTLKMKTSIGLFGGLAVADNGCQQLAPTDAIYKAMLTDDKLRKAPVSGQGPASGVDWVFRANAQYFRIEDSILIGTTNADGVFDFPLANALSASPGVGKIWTGLDAQWASSSNSYFTNCRAWGDPAASHSASSIEPSARFGVTKSKLSTSIFSGAEFCAGSSPSTFGIICVEQPKPQNRAYKYLFVTSDNPANAHNGNFGGIPGADQICAGLVPSTLPEHGPFKAMLVDGVNRVATTAGSNSAAGQLDWVLKPNQEYRRADDGAAIMITNSAGLFDFSKGNLENAFSAKGNTGIWTGIAQNWTTWIVAGFTSCEFWTTSNKGFGVLGNANVVTARVLMDADPIVGGGTEGCSSIKTAPSYGDLNLGLACVEQ